LFITLRVAFFCVRTALEVDVNFVDLKD
jgi:hypothetical protein